MEKIRKKNIDNGQKGKHRTDNFKGTSFVTDKNNWVAQLQHNKKHYYLGEFVNEIEAAQVYNDFALFLNETENTLLVNWYYLEDDEDLEEAGNSYSYILGLKFNMIPYNKA